MERTSGAQSVKCVVWDLDNTLWDGILLEDAEVRLKPHTIEVVKTLDARGVLQPLASRNFAESAMAKLDEFGLGDYFLAPQIGWIAKSAAIRAICAELNLAPDAIAFLDDDPFERDEVGFALPQVRCWEPADLLYLLDLPEVTYSTITVESPNRRSAYQQDAHRVADAQAAESEIEFLTSLHMRLRIASATVADLDRLHELTCRTQLLGGATPDVRRVRRTPCSCGGAR